MTPDETFDMDAMIAQLIPEECKGGVIEFVVYDDATGLPIKPGSNVIGNPTIGIGRNLYTNGLSQSEAVFLCSNDIMKAASIYDLHIPWWRQLSPMRQRQLIDMGFNMGAMEIVDGWPNFLRCMQQGDWSSAVQAMQSSKWWFQVGTRAPAIAARILAG